MSTKEKQRRKHSWKQSLIKAAKKSDSLISQSLKRKIKTFQTSSRLKNIVANIQEKAFYEYLVSEIRQTAVPDPIDEGWRKTRLMNISLKIDQLLLEK